MEYQLTGRIEVAVTGKPSVRLLVYSITRRIDLLEERTSAVPFVKMDRTQQRECMARCDVEGPSLNDPTDQTHGAC